MLLAATCDHLRAEGRVCVSMKKNNRKTQKTNKTFEKQKSKKKQRQNNNNKKTNNVQQTIRDHKSVVHHIFWI